MSHKQSVRALGILGLLLFGAAGAPCVVAGEILAYIAPNGQRLYTDRPIEDRGYRPANAAARYVRKHGPRRSVAARADVARIDALIDRLAPRYALDPALVKAVVAAESNYRADALSRRNAQGLMQLIPATAERFGVVNPWDVEQNLRGGMAYLSWLMGEFRGRVPLVLAAYNAGENAVREHGGIPPFPETRAYVRKITRSYPRSQHPYVRLARSS